MSKKPRIDERLTREEWDDLPITLTSLEVAKACGRSLRYVQNHPEDFDGRMVAGRWCFAKAKVAKAIGLEVE